MANAARVSWRATSWRAMTPENIPAWIRIPPHWHRMPPHVRWRAVELHMRASPGKTYSLSTHADARLTHGDARASACVHGRGGAAGGVVGEGGHGPRVTAARRERQGAGVRGREPDGGVAAPPGLERGRARAGDHWTLLGDAPGSWSSVSSRAVRRTRRNGAGRPGNLPAFEWPNGMELLLDQPSDSLAP